MNAMILMYAVTGDIPCELDPFCDDPDGPIEVPLDDGVLLALTAILLLFVVYSRFSTRKNAAT